MTTVLDVVVPVHDEEAVLASSVHRLHAHLEQTFPYPFRITVADIASTDGTWQAALRLVATLPAVAAVRLEEKSRGRALRQVWSESDAAVLASVDVDLSTDLDALGPLVAPLVSGDSDAAVGTRPHRARLCDAPCGFTAIRADVAAVLMPLVEDTTWFFDTELLVLAERCGLRVHEAPGDGVAARIGRGPAEAPRSMRAELAVFAVVGVLSTVLHLGGFVVLRQVLASAPSANAVALLVAAVANTWANRRWTFGVRGRAGAARHQAQGLLVLALTLGLTTAGLDLLRAAVPDAPTWAETTVIAATTAAATAVKFLAMKLWVFAPGPLRPFAPRRRWSRDGATAKHASESSSTTTPVRP